MLPAYSLKIDKLAESLKTNLKTGLSSSEASARLRNQGPNELREDKGEPLLLTFLKQFQSPLIYILMVAAGITTLLGDFSDSLIIWAVLIFNAVIGFYQEQRAERTVQALKRFLSPNAKVIRGGEERLIPARNLVIGDIVLLQAGDRVPGDGRIISSSGLQVVEAMLTGESLPSDKNPGVLPGVVDLGDRENMVYMGTLTVSGSGIFVVTSVGASTEIGKIAKLVQVVPESKTPLQQTIDKFGHYLAIVVLSISSGILLIGLAAGRPFSEMLGTAVSLTVSAIPEGLPVVLTVTLAIGMWRMAQKQAVVRRLPAVETLGEVTTICTDKTGTLTRAEMMVEQIIMANESFSVAGDGYLPKATFYRDGKRLIDLPDQLKMVGQLCAVVSNAHLSYKEGRNELQELIGDPTEAAVLALGFRLGFDHPEDKILVMPFDEHRRYSVASSEVEGRKATVYLGAPETMMGLSSKFLSGGKENPLHKKTLDYFSEEQRTLASQGYRIVSLAYTFAKSDAKKPRELTFVGLLAMQDPLRVEAKDALAAAKSAGIRVIMLTGDHLLTAQHIAKKLGFHDSGDVLEAQQLTSLSQEDFDRAVLSLAVVARATPSDKLKIVEALKRQGQIVAMTGDGVNDAPALKTADIGIAMGRAGTDVATEASDMVLLDDNFSHIVSAIEEGRVIWSNLRKVIFYLLSTSLGEIMTILASLLLGLPLPVIAAQIIWLNLVTDGVSTIPLSLEKKEGDVLRRPPRRPNEGILGGLMVGRMFMVATVMMVGTLILFTANLHRGLEIAQTSALLVLAAFQWFNVWNARSEGESVFSIGFFSNRYISLSTIAAVALQVGATYLPFMQEVLGTAPLTIWDWAIALTIGSSIIFIEELRKLIFRNFKFRNLSPNFQRAS